MSDTKRAANCGECRHWGPPFEADDELGLCRAVVPEWASLIIDADDYRRTMRWNHGTDCPVSEKKEVEG